MSRPVNTPKDEGDAICEGVLRLVQSIRRRQLDQSHPIRRDPYHDALMRSIYPDEDIR